jgi:type VI protein secretion system component VasA
MKASTDSGRLDGVLAGDGIQVSSMQSGGAGTDTQTITLGTPDTLTATTTDATTGGSHTHALTSSSDTSGASAAVILSANTTGGLKVEELDINSGSLKLTDHATAPTVTANKLYANTTSIFWENNDLMVGTGVANQQFVSGIAIAMAIALG